MYREYILIIILLYSLLDVLAGRNDPSGLSGTVLVNGERQPNNFKCITGYVVQVRKDFSSHYNV